MNKKVVTSLAVLASICGLLQAPTMALGHEDDPRGIMTDAELDAHAEMFYKAYSQRNNFLSQVQDSIANGTPIDIASGKCTYISSIFNPPPPKTVVLTFDDGPTASMTFEILDILKKYDIKATFFFKGNMARANPRSVKAVLAAGHLIGNHSWSHPDFHTISAGEQTNQVTTTDSLLSPQMPGLRLFRYPYGNSTCATNQLVKKMGYDGIVGWHIDSCDWAFAKTGRVSDRFARICEVIPENQGNLIGHVLQQAREHNGGIILLHEIHSRTVASLEAIITGLLNEGFQFANLDSPGMNPYFQ